MQYCTIACLNMAGQRNAFTNWVIVLMAAKDQSEVGGFQLERTFSMIREKMHFAMGVVVDSTCYLVLIARRNEEETFSSFLEPYLLT